jgi:hypothetical protein
VHKFRKTRSRCSGMSRWNSPSWTDSPPDTQARRPATITGSLARCPEQVPAGVPAGLHLCYGDYQHQHFKQPGSLQLQVRLLDAVSAAAWRPVSFASFTAPQHRRDQANFSPPWPACSPGRKLSCTARRRTHRMRP